MYTLVNNTSRLSLAHARDKSAAINVPRISNMARIFARDVLARRSAPTIGRAINRSPGSLSLPPLTPMPKYPPDPWRSTHTHTCMTDAHSYVQTSMYAHVCTYTYSRDVPSFPRISGEEISARAGVPRRRFPEEISWKVWRESIASPQRVRLRWVCFFPSPFSARFPSVAMAPLPFAAAAEEATSMQRHEI